jgi:NADH-quinone oxidoreductase subunit F
MNHRLNSIEEFLGLRDRLRADQDPTIPTIVIPAGTCGQASGANDLIRVAKRELLTRKLADQIHLCITGCHGFCETEPCVVVEPRGTYYPRVGVEEMERIIRALSRGKVCEELFYVDPDFRERIEKKKDIPFFRQQGRTLLSRGERIDPIRIYHYLVNGGYSAFTR